MGRHVSIQDKSCIDFANFCLLQRAGDQQIGTEGADAIIGRGTDRQYVHFPLGQRHNTLHLLVLMEVTNNARYPFMEDGVQRVPFFRLLLRDKERHRVSNVRQDFTHSVRARQ